MTDSERLEALRKLSRFDLDDQAIDSETRAARAQYDAIAEKIEAQEPDSY